MGLLFPMVERTRPAAEEEWFSTLLRAKYVRKLR